MLMKNKAGDLSVLPSLKRDSFEIISPKLLIFKY